MGPGAGRSALVRSDRAAWPAGSPTPARSALIIRLARMPVKSRRGSANLGRRAPQGSYLPGRSAPVFAATARLCEGLGSDCSPRDMTAGQKAMASPSSTATAALAAAARRETRQTLPGFRSVYLRSARSIIRWSETKATDVLNGALPFDQVLKEMNGEAEKSRGNTGRLERAEKVEHLNPLPRRPWLAIASGFGRSMALMTPCAFSAPSPPRSAPRSRRGPPPQPQRHRDRRATMGRIGGLDPMRLSGGATLRLTRAPGR